MKKRLIAALAALAVTVPLTSAASATPASFVPVTYTSGFENGDWDGWSPEDGGNSRGWWIDFSTAQAHSGSGSLNYQLDGRWDNGTIWIERQFTGPVATSVPVTVTYWGWSPPQAPSATLAGTWPTTASIQTVDHDLGAHAAPWASLLDWDLCPEYYQGGWHQYTDTKNVDTTTSAGAINVAVAIHANFEGKLTYLHFDDVSVTIG